MSLANRLIFLASELSARAVTLGHCPERGSHVAEGEADHFGGRRVEPHLPRDEGRTASPRRDVHPKQPERAAGAATDREAGGQHVPVPVGAALRERMQGAVRGKVVAEDANRVVHSRGGRTTADPRRWRARATRPGSGSAVRPRPPGDRWVAATARRPPALPPPPAAPPPSGGGPRRRSDGTGCGHGSRSRPSRPGDGAPWRARSGAGPRGCCRGK